MGESSQQEKFPISELSKQEWVKAYVSPKKQYGYTDSPLEATPLFNRIPGWKHIEEPVSQTFAEVLPEGRNMRECIETILRPRRGQAVGIEFGGPGSRLFQGFTQGVFTRTLGVTLVDERTLHQEIRDKRSKHVVIGGDLREEQTKQLVHQWLGDRQADVIIERMKGGLYPLTHDPHEFLNLVNEWYTILNSGGLMFVQARDFMTPILPRWVNQVQRQAGDAIQIISKPEQLPKPKPGSVPSSVIPWTNLFIYKKSLEAPLSLPQLKDLDPNYLLSYY